MAETAKGGDLVDDTEIFRCEKCNKVFKSLAVLKGHETIHITERTFKCSLCNKLFATQKYLKIHQAVHSDKNLLHAKNAEKPSKPSAT